MIKESVDNSNIDTIVEQVQNAATSVNSNTLVALTGNEGTSGVALLNLLQAESRMLQAVADPTPVTAGVAWTSKDAASTLAYWLNPTILSGLLISCFILSILIFGMLQLFYVQTPEVFVNTSIDFGKIEK